VENGLSLDVFLKKHREKPSLWQKYWITFCEIMIETPKKAKKIPFSTSTLFPENTILSSNRGKIVEKRPKS